MNAAAAIGGGMLGGLLVAGWVFLRTRSSVLLGQIESQLAALRKDIAGHRAAQDNLGASLERRMGDLEQAVARATNEVLMVSDELTADHSGGSSSDRDRLQLVPGQRQKDTSSHLPGHIAFPPRVAAPHGCVGPAWWLPCWADAPGSLDHLLTTAEPADL